MAKLIDWLPHYCPSGTSVGMNLIECQSNAKKFNKRIIFIFNYCDLFEVYPDGKWTCKRIGGGMPVLGPNSEFIPKEGWSKFFGH